ncbi:restriction endonuclease subunit S [Blautia sp.]|uniref:restriction endonuclease subunit S n=1 Tax=Blautia sp. TaxID=1955243 RepID=UPI003D908EBB
MPYEKVGKNEPICIADEVPFDIPDSWEWARLGSVIELQSGQDMTPDKYNDNGNGIPYITGASNIIDGTVIINRWTTCGKAFAHRGDILLTCKGTVGTMAILQEEIVHIARQIMAIRPIENLYVPYIQLVLETMVENLKAAAKSMIPGISRNDVLTSLFPVPPLNEQHRIIAKLKEVDPYVCQYDKSESILRHMDNIFPEALKKSILQWAVQGKLVPQDPNDEPAEALLERIRAEKLKLIKEGKIKKDKHESVIFRRDNSHYEKRGSDEVCIDGEIPFEIPAGWNWSRLGTCLDVRDGTHDTPRYVTEGVPLVTSKNLSNGKIDFTTAKLISREDSQAINQRSNVDSGDIMYAMIGSIGNPVLYQGSDEFSIKNMALFKRVPNGMDMEYVYWFLVLVQEDMKKAASGGVQSFVSLGYLRNYLIPVPPIAEQKRICSTIGQIIPLLAGL